jgi:hemolysin activation/secretion protein
MTFCRKVGPGVVLALASAVALAQTKPDSGQILQQVQEPLRLPPRTAPDVTPKPPPPPPALKPQPKLRVTVTRFTFTGNTLYSEAALQDVVKEFVGKSLDFNELNDVATAVRAYHRQRGYFLAQAYLPEQVIRDGAVQIAIIEGRVGVLELARRPASRLREGLLAGIISSHLNEGDLITETGLERPLLLINDLPTAVVASEIRRSKTVGAADLRVNVDKGEDLVSGYVDLDNEGNRFTGEYRRGLNVNLNNPTGFGDQASFRGFNTDEKMWYSRLSYLVPVNYYGTRVGASYSRFDYRLAKTEFEALRANGEGEVTSIYGFHPFVRTRNTNFIVQLSYEDRHLTDRVESANTVSERFVSVLKTNLVGDFRDGFLGGGLNAYTFSFSNGNVGIAPGADVVADLGGRQTLGDYKTWQLQARRLQRVTENTSFLASLAMQRASKNLTSSEKFAIGGPNAVRAYPVSEGSGDEGMVFQAELRYVVPGVRPLGGDFTVMGFFDQGESKLNRKPLATDNPNFRSISGFGVGATLGKEGNFLARVYAAWSGDKEVPQSDDAPRTPRFWFHVVKYF